MNVDPRKQRVTAGDREHRDAQVALQPAAELCDQPDRLQRQHRHQLPPVS
jgi:hypothetical protein